ncbi:MAG: aminotransferase class V-fold PLP-dependent enzyme [Gammaproteobacteria bacterium]|nr:aminotransferase class V-fold PLP-dependent enzyme [Gammaproteobacteria bacterium]
MSTPYADQFPQHKDLCYLNHAAVAPWPRCARDAVIRFANENCAEGATHYPRWLRVEQDLRENLARLIQAPSADDIALVKNTSEALSFVAGGLAWLAGDEIIITDQEFPSNRIVWESLRDQGVIVRVAALNDAATPEDAIERCLSPRTRLIAISAVQYGTGLRMDLAKLAALCKTHNLLFCVDAIQAIGAEPLDVQALGVDFCMADGHKWMLGPEGLGLFYVKPGLREHLKLMEFGWHMVRHRGDYDRLDWEPAPDARRFECGSPNLLGIHALEASTRLLLEVGLDTVRESLQQHLRHLRHQLASDPRIHILTPEAPERHAGILTFRVDGADHGLLHRRLMEAGVICASRGGGIRFSPHFYTTPEVIDRAVSILRGLS